MTQLNRPAAQRLRKQLMSNEFLETVSNIATMGAVATALGASIGLLPVGMIGATAVAVIGAALKVGLTRARQKDEQEKPADRIEESG